MDAQGDKSTNPSWDVCNWDRPPYPRTPYIPDFWTPPSKTTTNSTKGNVTFQDPILKSTNVNQSKLDSPSFSAVSSEQLHAFQESQQDAQPGHSTMILQPTQSDDDDVSTHDLATQFQWLLAGYINNDDVN